MKTNCYIPANINFIFAASAHYYCLYLTSTDWMPRKQFDWRGNPEMFWTTRRSCSYRSSKSRRYTDISGWKRIATFPPTSILFLQLPLVITAFIWQVRIGCQGNSLIDVEEKPKILKCFGQHRSRVDWNSWKQANWNLSVKQLALIISLVNYHLVDSWMWKAVIHYTQLTKVNSHYNRPNAAPPPPEQ